MSKCVKAITWILGILSVIVLGITLINLICDESYSLLMYDIKNKFADNMVYVVFFVLLIFIVVWGGGYIGGFYVEAYLSVGSVK